MKSIILELGKTVFIAVLLAVAISLFVFNITRVDGKSMEPTLHHNDRLVNAVYPLFFSEPKVGDIVVFQSPIEEKKNYVKRVIGIPGDVIEIVDGKVFINDVQIDESYIEKEIDTQTQIENSWELKEEEYFVMGDNRHPRESVDSRYFGPIQKSSIKGIIKVRYYPFREMGML